jgi:hypothetical protein
MGLTDVRLVGPDTGDAGTVAASYISGMMGDATVAGRVDHFGVHHYNGSASAGTFYPGHDYWLTETAATCSNCDQNGVPSQGEWAFSSQTAEAILGSLQQGMAAALIWDGYDSYYYHHNAVGTYGLLAYNAATGVYTPRKRYFVDAQIYGFINPGMVRVAESDAIGALGAVPAFFDSSSGRIAIIGQNTTNAPTTISGQINNLPSPSVLAFFMTDSGSASLLRGTDIPVSSGAFTVTIPANTIFTLVSGATQALGVVPDPPTTVAVSSAFPNPMIGNVAFTLSLTREDDVSVSILDIQGRQVWSAPAQLYGPGRWTIGWDGTTPSGTAGAGTYFARIRVGSRLFVRRVALLR